jgi:hypothetical protein
MKGAAWEMWMWGTIAIFIAAMSFYVFTPYLEQITSSARGTTDFLPAINDSVNQRYTNINNLWSYWPLALIGLALVLIVVVAADEDEFQRRGF